MFSNHPSKYSAVENGGNELRRTPRWSAVPNVQCSGLVLSTVSNEKGRRFRRSIFG